MFTYRSWTKKGLHALHLYFMACCKVFNTLLDRPRLARLGHHRGGRHQHDKAGAHRARHISITTHSPDYRNSSNTPKTSSRELLGATEALRSQQYGHKWRAKG